MPVSISPFMAWVRKPCWGSSIASGRGENREIHDIPGTAYAIGKHGRPHFYPQKNWQQGTPWWEQTGDFTDSILELPSYDEIRGHDDVSKERFARAQHLFHREQNPDSAPILVQRHGDHTLVVNRPMKALNGRARSGFLTALQQGTPPELRR